MVYKGYAFLAKTRALYRRFSTKAPIYGHARINTGNLVTLVLGNQYLFMVEQEHGNNMF